MARARLQIIGCSVRRAAEIGEWLRDLVEKRQVKEQRLAAKEQQQQQSLLLPHRSRNAIILPAMQAGYKVRLLGMLLGSCDR